MPARKRALWTEEALKAALQAVTDGMSKKKAAMTFGIPRGTLQKHVKVGDSSKKLGRSGYLSSVQEDELCKRIFRLDEIGMPLTPSSLRRSVYTFCKENTINVPNSESCRNMVSRKWLKLFLARHPNVARRSSQNVNPGRAAKLNKHIVDDYFKTLRNVMLEVGVMQSPGRIFNMDEKGCQLTLHKPPKVYARKGVKRVPYVAPEHAQNDTIVTCGNDLGNVIPPFILYKESRRKPAYSDKLLAGSDVFMKAKGSMTHIAFVK